ncbi:hypothetical protein UCDDS831_g06663 [Diplodia seriata]|uniref:Uncharacterized protein n=1 Tax=Diplodia seriata TaxID=420778 RepID=A0A0G2GJ17_9PEZI|nr:hypothetical protein UCDDS831_g06663 [Diplodia seriata]
MDSKEGVPTAPLARSAQLTGDDEKMQEPKDIEKQDAAPPPYHTVTEPSPKHSKQDCSPTLLAQPAQLKEEAEQKVQELQGAKKEEAGFLSHSTVEEAILSTAKDLERNAPPALLARRAQITEGIKLKEQEIKNFQKQGQELDEQIKRESEASDKKKRKYDQFLTERRHADGSVKPAYLQSELDTVIPHMQHAVNVAKLRLEQYEYLRRMIGLFIRTASERTDLVPSHFFTEAEIDSIDGLHEMILADKKKSYESFSGDFAKLDSDIYAMIRKIHGLE